MTKIKIKMIVKIKMKMIIMNFQVNQIKIVVIKKMIVKKKYKKNVKNDLILIFILFIDSFYCFNNKN